MAATDVIAVRRELARIYGVSTAGRQHPATTDVPAALPALVPPTRRNPLRIALVLHPLRRRAAQPDVETDFTNYRLAGGQDVEILNFLDDHSRYLLACVAFARVTGPTVVAVFRDASPVAACRPACCPTTAWSSPPASPAAATGRNARNGFETELTHHRVVQKTSFVM